DLHPFQAVPVEDSLIGAVENRLQRDARSLVCREALDQQLLAALDPVLLASALDDRVHGLSTHSVLARTFAAERRRPPLRPRRRDGDFTGSGALGAGVITSPSSSSKRALAAVRPTWSIRTIRFSPTFAAAPAIEMMYPSIFATASS